MKSVDPTDGTDVALAARSFSVASRESVVDERPPQTTVTDGPPSPSYSASASFEFESDEAGSTFQCSVDSSSDWKACSSPKALEGLSEGNHYFYVRAIDRAGNVDQSAASRSWVVDAVDPETRIARGPEGVTRTRDVIFTFEASEPVTRFECRLDGGSWSTCSSSGYELKGMADGAHVLEVRALDLGGSVDTTPARREWKVDTQAPRASLNQSASGQSGPAAASFSFSSNEEDSDFECQMDDGSWGQCSSPARYPALAQGDHTFRVRATDQAGNREDAGAAMPVTITAAPETTLRTAPSGATRSREARLEYSGSWQSTDFECRLDGGSWSPCADGKSYSGLPDGDHTFEVRALKEGAADPTPATAAWSVDATAPSITFDESSSGATGPDAASFSFTASERSDFECSLDADAWKTCSSPARFEGLAAGQHVFRVRASDALGNRDDAGRSRVFSVAGPSKPPVTPPPPKPRPRGPISTAPKAPAPRAASAPALSSPRGVTRSLVAYLRQSGLRELSDQRRIGFRFRGDRAGRLKVEIVASVQSRGKRTARRLALGRAAVSFRSVETRTVTLHLSRRVRRALSRAPRVRLTARASFKPRTGRVSRARDSLSLRAAR